MQYLSVLIVNISTTLLHVYDYGSVTHGRAEDRTTTHPFAFVNARFKLCCCPANTLYV